MTTDQTIRQLAGHTPGPWIADGYDVRQPVGRYVAYTGPSHTPADEYPAACARQDRANAVLIAAAPELLEDRNELRAQRDELLAALEAATEAIAHANEHARNEQSHALELSCRAAIAKAKGGTT